VKRLNRLQTNDRVKVTNSESDYFGRTGVVVDIAVVPVRMIKGGGKPISSSEETRILVRLDGLKAKENFAPHQLKKLP
jgi:hypothetical protein